MIIPHNPYTSDYCMYVFVIVKYSRKKEKGNLINKISCYKKTKRKTRKHKKGNTNLI